MDAMMGKTKLESFEDFEKMMAEKVGKYKEENDPKKKEDTERKLKKRIHKFFKGLKKLGVEVELEGKDGKGDISIWDNMKDVKIERLFGHYVIDTIKEINKEVERRNKEQ